MKRILYTDFCHDNIRRDIEEDLNLEVIVRNKEKWNLQYIISILTNPMTTLVVINDITEMSIAEMTLGIFMCKKVLVTNPCIKEYNGLLDFYSDLEPSCSLKEIKSSFKTWFNFAME